MRSALCLACLLVGATVRAEQPATVSEYSDPRALFGDAAVNAIAADGTIEAFRLKSGFSDEELADFEAGRPHPKKEGQPLFQRHEILAHVQRVDRKLAAELKKELVRNDTFPSHGFISSCFDPGVGLRFKPKGKTSKPVEVLICFECGAIEVTYDGAGEPHTEMGEAFNRLLGLAKRLFPYDMALSSIKERKSPDARPLWSDAKDASYLPEVSDKSDIWWAPNRFNRKLRPTPDGFVEEFQAILWTGFDRRHWTCPPSSNRTYLQLEFRHQSAAVTAHFDFASGLVSYQIDGNAALPGPEKE
jgi:hypothetical protein